MIPQQVEHFQVLKTNTKRFKESPIVHMQNILNNDIKRRMEKNNLWNIWTIDFLLSVNLCGGSSYCCLLITENKLSLSFSLSLSLSTM